MDRDVAIKNGKGLLLVLTVAWITWSFCFIENDWSLQQRAAMMGYLNWLTRHLLHQVAINFSHKFCFSLFLEFHLTLFILVFELKRDNEERMPMNKCWLILSLHSRYLSFSVITIFTISVPVNSISISGMLAGQWNVKPRWPPVEGNFVRQFQSPIQAYTSVLVSHETVYVFWRALFENTHKACLQKTKISLRISNILRQSLTELQAIYFHENKLPNWRETW